MPVQKSSPSLCGALDRHAKERPRQLALRFLPDGEADGRRTEISFGELHARVLSVATALQGNLKPGDRALLLYEGGPDFVIAFLGCLYAGVIAVPTYPPDSARIHRTLPRLQAIAADAQSRLILTTFDLQQAAEPLSSQAEQLKQMIWLSTDRLEPRAASWEPRSIEPDGVAYLQYTSGSTGTPKGVVISHENLAVSCQSFYDRFRYSEESQQIFWLPTFHDLGLVWGLLTPLYGGFPSTFMLPGAFLQRPARWLEAITRFGGTHTAAPNFAYELCLRKVREGDLQHLGLSTLRAAMNAAEPVRAATIRDFIARFEPVGFRKEAMCPGYGLAEATVPVSLAWAEAPATVLAISASALEQRCVKLVPEGDPDSCPAIGCGPVFEVNRVAIVDPENGRALADGSVGEVWVAGPVVAQGYWRRPEDTAQTFGARLVGDEHEEPIWLRTGDLGFLYHDELFICGRLKDLIIVRGRNLYPQDLELLAERTHPAVRPGCVAAFPLEVRGEECVGLVAEIEVSRLGAGTPAELLHPIRIAVADAFDVHVHDLVLVPPRALFKTSSGKLERRRTRAALADGGLEILARWTRSVAVPQEVGSASDTSNLEERIWAWLREMDRLALPAAPLRDVPFRQLGLDSVSAVEVSGRIAEALGRPMPPTLLFNHPTLRALVEHLTGAAQGSAEARLSSSFSSSGAWEEPIAIVSMACRFPGRSETPEALWRLLDEGTDAITEVPRERWEVDAYFSDQKGESGKTLSRWGGFLPDLAGFDAAFFGLSIREASSLDPQGRLLLETVWESLERAGIAPTRLNESRTGVYMGLCGHEYEGAALADLDGIDGYSLLGTAPSAVVGRLSYTLGLKGPNIAVDTACSSSLTAVHLACQGLRSGECSLALAGGVNILLSPEYYVYFSRAGALSPTGRCHAFGADANGYVRAEGCGVVLLKRLSDAQRDGDQVLAILRGTAVNQDGRSNGLTAPHGPSQESVIRQALANAGVEPAAISYVECHGTGTPLGDPIEVQALAAVYGEGRSYSAPVRIGSIKSNIGHTEGAAGIAGLMKVVLSLQHRRLPRSLHTEKLNPHIPWAELPVRVTAEPEAWSEPDRPLRAGVSSFGFSGTNVHVIVEEAPSKDTVEDLPASAEPATPRLFTGSGQSAPAVRANAARLASWLRENPTASLASVAHTLNCGRSHFAQRIAMVCSSHAELIEASEAAAAGGDHPALRAGEAGLSAKVAFVFSGHGSQWSGMGRVLYAQEPVFAEAVRTCDDALRPHLGWSVRELLVSEDAARLGEGRVDQVHPCLFAMAVGLTELWRSLGVSPDAVVGHSVGEIAAACCTGALSLAQGAALVVRRSQLLLSAVGTGAMGLVELPAHKVKQHLAGYADRLGIAAVNSDHSTVISGDSDALDRVLRELEQSGVFCRKVPGANAPGHSPQMEPLAAVLRDEFTALAPSRGSVPMCSSVTGDFVDGTELLASYWARNLRQPVLYAQAIKRLAADGYRFFIEISAHPLLTSATTSLLERARVTGCVVGSLRRDEGGRASVLRSVAGLYVQGFPIDLPRLQSSAPSVRSQVLPTYAFQREPCWLESSSRSASPSGRARPSVRSGGHPLLGHSFTMSAHSSTQYCEQILDLKELPWLADHRLDKAILLPGAAFAEMALSAAREILGESPLVLEDLDLREALILQEKEPARIQVALHQEDAQGVLVRISSAAPSREGTEVTWVSHATGRVGTLSATESSRASLTLDRARAECRAASPPAAIYAHAAAVGAHYGPAFQGIMDLSEGESQVLARVRLPQAAGASAHAPYLLHPALLDSCFQSLLALLRERIPDEGAAFVPVSIGRLSLFKRSGDEVFCHALLAGPPEDAGRLSASLRIWDADGALVADIEELVLQSLAPRGKDGHPAADSYLQVAWQEQPAPQARSCQPGERWLILSDRGGLADRLEEALTSTRCRVLRRSCARTGQADGNTSVCVDPRDAEAVSAMLQEVLASPAPLTGIFFLWGLDAPEPETLPEAGLIDAGIEGWGGALHVIQALYKAAPEPLPRLILVTQKAQPVGLQSPVRIEQTLLWGLGSSLCMEAPGWRTLRIDLSDPTHPEEISALVREALSPSLREQDDQVVLRGSTRSVPRLRRIPAPKVSREVRVPAGRHSYRIEVDEPGLLESLTIRGVKPLVAAANEVVVALEAYGMNFRDVLLGMGLVPALSDGPVLLGLEGAGRISAVGQGVQGLREGDRVMVMARSGVMGSEVVVPVRQVVPLPPWLSMVDGAGLLSVHLTAYYGLAITARLRRGERVLIHSAAGGVGLAAIQWAQHVGAEIFATAGSQEKREYLRSLGIRHVSDSRSARFVEDIRAWTNGEGVDVVLNSLSGSLREKSLKLLRSRGRFVELGIRDYLADVPLGLAPFVRGLSMSMVDVVRLMESPEELQSVLSEILARVEQGVLKPLPTRVYPLAEAVAALRKMSQGQHIGKFVLMRDGAPLEVAVPAAEERPVARRDGSYLITGGLGGLGLTLGEWLSQQGAGHVVLLGRKGVTTAAQRTAIGRMESAGARVTVAQADVACRAELARVLGALPEAQPLRGIIHAAAVLSDGLLQEQSLTSFRKVLAPKVLGALNLHVLSRSYALDFFVLYSSAAALLGSPGQANYVAANSALDALAHHRRALGLPATSINWGPFSEVGGAASEEKRGNRLAERGMPALTPHEGLSYFSAIVRADPIQMGVVKLNFPKWAEFYPAVNQWPYMEELRKKNPAPSADDPGDWLSRLRALSPEIAAQRMTELVRAQVARVVRQAPERIKEKEQALFKELGIDSLMGLELRNRLGSLLKVSIPAAAIWSHPTIAKLGEHLLSVLGLEPVTKPRRDWQAECRLDDSIRPAWSLPQGLPPRRILLTGATGFLGGFVLSELLRRTAAEVYCLVRAEDEGVGLLRIRNNLEALELWEPAMTSRIRAVPGDLEAPRLGLAPDLFSELAESIDLIIHVAALVNFLYPYEVCRAANVDSTQEILRLAAQGRMKSVHHVSSLVVLSNQWTEPDEQQLPVEIETLGKFRSMCFAAGYAQSKAVADLMAHEARARGIPVSVYRVGMVSGGARIGGWAQTDMAARMLKTWIELGHAYPSVVVMTPADEVAQFIVDRALAGDGPGRTWHVDTPHRYHMSELAERLRALGFEVQIVSYEAYRSILRDHLKSPPIAGLFEILPEQWDNAFYEVFCQMNCSQTQEAMRRTGAALQPLDEALLGRYIRTFQRAGFLRK